MAELRNAGDSLELREQPPPEDEYCVDCASRGIGKRACFGARGTRECTLCGTCAVACDKDGLPLHEEVELCAHMRDPSQRFVSKSAGVTTGGTDRASGVSTEATQVRSDKPQSDGDGSACAGDTMRHGTNYMEFTVLDSSQAVRPKGPLPVGESEEDW
jgi:hypothetical protein